MSTRYIYGGASTNLGRHGPVVKGTVISLTDEEVATVVGNPDFQPLPTGANVGRSTKRVSANPYQAVVADRNLVLAVNKAAAPSHVVVLPDIAELEVGWNVVVAHDVDSADLGPISVEAFTAQEVDAGSAKAVVVNAARLFYFNGTSFTSTVADAPFVEEEPS